MRLNRITKQAEKEGWSIFYSYPVNNDLEYRIERLDSEGIFADDKEAIKFVLSKVIEGSDTHIGAINFIKDNSPDEYKYICKIFEENFD